MLHKTMGILHKLKKCIMLFNSFLKCFITKNHIILLIENSLLSVEV